MLFLLADLIWGTFPRRGNKRAGPLHVRRQPVRSGNPACAASLGLRVCPSVSVTCRATVFNGTALQHQREITRQPHASSFNWTQAGPLLREMRAQKKCCLWSQSRGRPANYHSSRCRICLSRTSRILQVNRLKLLI